MIYTVIFTKQDYDNYNSNFKQNILTVCEERVEYICTSINTPHDRVFRKILDDKNEAIKIINRVLKENEKLKSTDIENYNSSFVNENLRNSEADIVYKIKGKDVFFLIEHQTRIDYSMPYRILKYELSIMDSVIIPSHFTKETVFPLVIPIVLYTGNQKWNAELDIQSMQYDLEIYEKSSFSKYNILDINDFDETTLLEENSFISKALLIEKSTTGLVLEDNLNKIIDIMNSNNFYTQEQKNLLITILQLVLRKKLSDEKITMFINKLRNGGDDKMLAVLDMLDRENARLRNEGIQEGIKTNQIEIAKKLLAKNMPIREISEVTGVSLSKIIKIKKGKI